jgi:hypothetical protein
MKNHQSKNYTHIVVDRGIITSGGGRNWEKHVGGYSVNTVYTSMLMEKQDLLKLFQE